jgi:hypothetical protein
MTIQFDSEVRKGVTITPTDNGGFIVQARGGDGGFRNPLGAFSNSSDLIAWLAGSLQSDVVVVSSQRFSEAISGAFVSGQASTATKQ